MQVTFSAPMDVSTLTEANIQVTRDGKPGKVQIHSLTYDEATRTLQIRFSLTYGETYRLELSGAIRDARGNSLAPTAILFTTGPNPAGK